MLLSHSGEYPCECKHFIFAANSPKMIRLARRITETSEALQIVTNACEFLTNPCECLGSSDHNIVLLRPTHGHSLEKGSPDRVTIRCMSSDNRATFSAMLSAVRWETMFRMRSCEEQFTLYKTVIDQLVCRCFPNKVVTRHSADKPWVTDGFS